MKTEWTLKEMSNWTRIDSEVKIPAIPSNPQPPS